MMHHILRGYESIRGERPLYSRIRCGNRSGPNADTQIVPRKTFDFGVSHSLRTSATKINNDVLGGGVRNEPHDQKRDFWISAAARRP